MDIFRYLEETKKRFQNSIESLGRAKEENDITKIQHWATEIEKLSSNLFLVISRVNTPLPTLSRIADLFFEALVLLPFSYSAWRANLRRRKDDLKEELIKKTSSRSSSRSTRARHNKSLNPT